MGKILAHLQRITRQALIPTLAFATICFGSCANAVEKKLTRQEAIAKSINALAGRGYFHNSVEIKASEDHGAIKVLFRRPTSDRMVTAGRKTVSNLAIVTCKAKSIQTKILTKSPASAFLDKTYSHKEDRENSRAITVACRELGKISHRADFEFAVEVSQEADGYSVMISSVPYMPGGFTVLNVTRDFKLASVTRGD